MAAEQEDVTGRRDLGWNVAVSWLGQVVVVIFGFVIPRLISDKLDQASLGVWDFGWSTVAYFRVLGLGLAGSLNRYVAYYRAQDALDQLRRAVSSTSALQILVALLTFAVAVGVGFASHVIFKDVSAELAHSARWLVILLGAGLAVRMACWASRGVLTGYHRWATNAAVSACGDVLVLIFIIVALHTGGGLVSLGISFLITTTITEALRTYWARRLYGEKLLQWSAVDAAMIKKMFVFGIKTNVSGLPALVVTQAVSMTLAAVAGPVALAIYARPLALTRSVLTVVAKFTVILTSTAASLQGLGQKDEVRELLLSSSRAAIAIALPLLAAVGIYGDVMVRVWMGPSYVDPVLPPILALGTLLPFANTAAMRVLTGLNAHGKVALASLATCATVMVLGSGVAFLVGWTPTAAAIIVAASLTAGPGVLVPVMACRRLEIGLRDYVRRGFGVPLLLNVPYLVILVLPRLYTAPSPLQTALVIVAAGAVLAGFYWRYLLTLETKRRLLVRFRLGRFGLRYGGAGRVG